MKIIDVDGSVTLQKEMDQIEVSEDMIDAGVEIFSACYTDVCVGYWYDSDVVAKVYKIMEAVKLKQAQKL